MISSTAVESAQYHDKATKFAGKKKFRWKLEGGSRPVTRELSYLQIWWSQVMIYEMRYSEGSRAFRGLLNQVSIIYISFYPVLLSKIFMGGLSMLENLFPIARLRKRRKNSNSSSRCSSCLRFPLEERGKKKLLWLEEWWDRKKKLHSFSCCSRKKLALLLLFWVSPFCELKKYDGEISECRG